MFKGHRRIDSFVDCSDKSRLFPKHKSVSYSKHSEASNLHRYRKIKPYYIMETDSAILPQRSREIVKSKYIPKEHNLNTDVLKIPKCKSKSKPKSKEKSSASRNKELQSKSKSKPSREKRQQFPKPKKSLQKKRKCGKYRSQQKSSKNVKQTSTNQFSYDKLSKTYKVTHQRSRSSHKKRSKSRGTRWQEILEFYGECLTVSEIAEIREIKVIYFLGKIKDRKNKQLFTVHKNKSSSARKHHNCSQSFEEEKLLVNQLLSERRPDFQSENHVSLPVEQLRCEFSDFYTYQIGDHIAYRYQIMESINKGAFGEVLKVFDHKHREFLALKIVKKSPELVQQTLVEISILTQIVEKDKEGLSGIVKIKDFTIFRKHICIMFELLENNLFELMAANNYKGFPEEQIRIFAIQLLNSLDFMKKQKIIHCDIKPENIVLSKWGKSGIKIVDFGTSCFEGKQIYQYLQSRYYRAPEIILGSKYSYPIDMWSLGCLLAELRLGEPIFAASNDIQHLMYIANSIGFPKSEDGAISQEFLRTPEMAQLIKKDYIGQYYEMESKQKIKNNPLFKGFKDIERSMLTFQDRLRKVDNADTQFSQFISKMLRWQPEQRIKPQKALEDPWIINGLPKEIKKIYVKISNTQKNSSKSKSKSKSKERGKKKESPSPCQKKSNSKSKSYSKNKQKTQQIFNFHSNQLNPARPQHLSRERHQKSVILNNKNNFLKAKLKGVLR